MQLFNHFLKRVMQHNLRLLLRLEIEFFISHPFDLYEKGSEFTFECELPSEPALEIGDTGIGVNENGYGTSSFD